MKGWTFLLFAVVVCLLNCPSQAFTATKKHETTSKRPAFSLIGDDGNQPQQSQPKNAFAVNSAAAAVAYGSYADYLYGEGDEELISYKTATISCLLSLILGFGLGYGI
jgi:hypothetical protein